MELNKIKERIFLRKIPTIKNKNECYMLYNAGFFGNKVETAESYDEIIQKGWRGTVSIRSRGPRIDRSLVAYNVLIENIPKELKRLELKGMNIEKVSLSKTPDDSKLIFQGEIMNSINGLHIVYSTLKKPMNVALKEEEKILTGILANQKLKENMTPASYDDIIELLNLFPEDVIEFSTYNSLIGTLQNRNTIIWEVRGY